MIISKNWWSLNNKIAKFDEIEAYLKFISFKNLYKHGTVLLKTMSQTNDKLCLSRTQTPLEILSTLNLSF